MSPALYNFEFQTIGVLFLIAVAVFFDIRARRIPNWLILFALPFSLALQMKFHSAWPWAGGILVGFALLLPGYVFKQMGAGDVKLMAAVGAFFGGFAAFKIVLTAYLIGGGYAVAWMAWQRDSDAWWQYIKLRVQTSWLLMATMSGQPLGDGALAQARPRTAAMPYSIPIAMAAAYALYAGW
jgi:prepilin peptidase CpaA